MIKCIPPGSYNWSVPAAQLILFSEQGLRGHDLSSLEKRAGAKIADAIRGLQFHRGEVPVHLIALSATEATGPNRNYDGFTEDCCRKYHDTFVKHGHVYRNHKNSDPAKSYGVIKASMYNEAMKRIELVIALNETKEAARRNGGLVADEELQKLARNDDSYAVSMSCRVPYDVCMVCGNKAKTRADYCLGTDEGGDCEGGGCKNNLGKVAEDGTITYVDNPHPRWFDISKVMRGADRSAFVFGPFKKAAQSLRVKGGAELAEEAGIIEPVGMCLANVTSAKLRSLVKLADEMAELEREIMKLNEQAKTLPGEQVKDISKLRDTNPRRKGLAFKALAKEKVALPLSSFLQVISECDDPVKIAEMTERVTPCVHGSFQRLQHDPEQLVEYLSNNPFQCGDGEIPTDLTLWAAKQSSAALTNPSLRRNQWARAIHGVPDQLISTMKSASDTSEAASRLADAYALYKLAFLAEQESLDYKAIAPLVVRLV